MVSTNGAPDAFTGFDRMPLAGRWRGGSAGATTTDTDPYTGETLTEIELADADDLNSAYLGAADAQREWASALPSTRAEVFLGAARVMEARPEEIIGWLVREAGAAWSRAEWEWRIVRAYMLEAGSFPSRVQGRILPAEVPGKESRVYRRPVAVVAVISPWNRRCRCRRPFRH